MHVRIVAILVVMLSVRIAVGKPQRCEGLTQLEMNACALDAQRESEAALARAVHAARGRLEPKEGEQLDTAESVWQRSTVEECELRHFRSRGGSAHAMHLAYCFAERASQRRHELDMLPLDAPY